MASSRECVTILQAEQPLKLYFDEIRQLSQFWPVTRPGIERIFLERLSTRGKDNSFLSSTQLALDTYSTFFCFSEISDMVSKFRSDIERDN